VSVTAQHYKGCVE